ncbi:MAG: hypothetical protein HC767_02800 [Akkermansiaceae bacterium]|nr:hypothetical protein [Akkermansiaceae bacterium]
MPSELEAGGKLLHPWDDLQALSTTWLCVQAGKAFRARPVHFVDVSSLEHVIELGSGCHSPELIVAGLFSHLDPLNVECATCTSTKHDYSHCIAAHNIRDVEGYT